MEKSLLGTRRSSLWLQLRQLSKSLGRQIFQRCQDVQFRSAWAAGGMLLRKGIAIIIPSYPIHRICFHQHVYRLNKGNCDILCDQIYYSTYGILMGPLFVCLFVFFHCRVWLMLLPPMFIELNWLGKNSRNKKDTSNLRLQVLHVYLYILYNYIYIITYIYNYINYSGPNQKFTRHIKHVYN